MGLSSNAAVKLKGKKKERRDFHEKKWHMAGSSSYLRHGFLLECDLKEQPPKQNESCQKQSSIPQHGVP